jgi:ABC-type transport system substrate-binding protein
MKIGKKKLKYLEKPASSATVSTTNPTWLDPGLSPGRRGGNPATNRLIYGAAYERSVSYKIV